MDPKELKTVQSGRCVRQSPTGLYIHIPFCARKCRYCDFYSIPLASGTPKPEAPGTDALETKASQSGAQTFYCNDFSISERYAGYADLQRRYCDALCRELDSYCEAGMPDADKQASSHQTVEMLNTGVQGEVLSEKCRSFADLSEVELPDLQLSGSSTEDKSSSIEDKISSAEDKISPTEDRKEKLEIDSIFFGGGTPSLIAPELTGKILEKIRRVFRVSDDCETTLEANPGTIDDYKAEFYLEHGINRISMGVQSFDDDVLAVLGRIHDAETAVRSYKLLRTAGFENINLDLMFAIPGMGMNTWMETLETAAALRPEHISMYGLQIEEGTPFYEMVRNGSMDPVSDELDREMYHRGIEFLKSKGYVHYEISNLSLPGKECRHNIKYWQMVPYIGAGAGAHSYYRGIRYSTPADIDQYTKYWQNYEPHLERSSAGAPPSFREVHANTLWDDISEYMFTGLRMSDGIDLKEFEKIFKKSFRQVYGSRELITQIDQAVEEGFLIFDEEKGVLKLTEKGIDISNSIMALFV